MKKAAIITAIALTVAACGTRKAEPVPFSVIPSPNQVTLHEGNFRVVKPIVSINAAVPEDSRKAINAFGELLASATGKKLSVTDALAKGAFTFECNPALADEEYTLDVNADGVLVTASSYSGFLYAIATLKQMMPAEVLAGAKMPVVLPCVSIQDKPRFAYRGVLLDACRHFWSIEETKRFIDIAALYKLNRLHWHLTEDQGWRIEIKKYPKLTEVGAWRNGTMIGKDFSSNDGIRYGGFYTQDELREMVAYAAERGITIIPEIDLPGHMVAALTAYPELGCTGGPYEVWSRWGISDEILCAGQEKTFEFLEDVLTEVMDIFPSEYIHIGGDEAPKTRWASCPRCQALIKKLGLKDKNGHTKEQYLQSAYVTKRVQDFLAQHGRKIIGGDEILEGELGPGATVMSWRGVKGGIEAANRGLDVVMSPNSYLYIDYYQSRERDKEPLAIGGYLPVERVYAYEPFDGLTEAAQPHILGVQANLWTEYIPTPEHLEYMLLPRMAALSEIQWCNADKKDFERFREALDHSARIFDALGYTYCKDAWGIIGLPGSEQPARTPEELEQYMKENKVSW